nr:uncharacterized protein LOC127321588 isoform X2 [Lolium perenne]
MEPPRQGRLPRSRTRTGAARNLRRHQGLPPETLSVFADLALHRVNKSSLPQPVRLQQHPPAFASSRIGSRSGVVRYDKFSGCPSTSFNRYEDMFDEDDVSKVTLPAWPGQGYGRHWLPSGLLVQFVSCPYSDVFDLLYDLDLCMYPFVS